MLTVRLFRGWGRAASPTIDAAEILRREERRLHLLVEQLPLEPRAKVEGELARALVSDPLRIDTPRGPPCVRGNPR